jgi:ethanolaminephosphotransferase
MGNPSSRLCFALANILLPVGIFLFAIGFFPYKPVLPGIADYVALEYAPKIFDSGSVPEAPFDKVVFMVVDALRR